MKIQKIKMEKVKSSNIDSVGYSEDHGLIIKFKGSGLYRFEYVPEDEYDSFLKASSQGKYFHSNIKGQYSCIKVDDITKQDFKLIFAENKPEEDQHGEKWRI